MRDSDSIRLIGLIVCPSCVKQNQFCDVGFGLLICCNKRSDTALISFRGIHIRGRYLDFQFGIVLIDILSSSDHGVYFVVGWGRLRFIFAKKWLVFIPPQLRWPSILICFHGILMNIIHGRWLFVFVKRHLVYRSRGQVDLRDGKACTTFSPNVGKKISIQYWLFWRTRICLVLDIGSPTE